MKPLFRTFVLGSTIELQVNVSTDYLARHIETHLPGIIMKQRSHLQLEYQSWIGAEGSSYVILLIQMLAITKLKLLHLILMNLFVTLYGFLYSVTMQLMLQWHSHLTYQVMNKFKSTFSSKVKAHNYGNYNKFNLCST